MLFVSPQARSPHRSAFRRLAFRQEKIYTDHPQRQDAGGKAEIAPANEPDGLRTDRLLPDETPLA